MSQVGDCKCNQSNRKNFLIRSSWRRFGICLSAIKTSGAQQVHIVDKEEAGLSQRPKAWSLSTLTEKMKAEWSIPMRVSCHCQGRDLVFLLRYWSQVSVLVIEVSTWKHVGICNFRPWYIFRKIFTPAPLLSVFCLWNRSLALFDKAKPAKKEKRKKQAKKKKKNCNVAAELLLCSPLRYLPFFSHVAQSSGSN